MYQTCILENISNLLSPYREDILSKYWNTQDLSEKWAWSSNLGPQSAQMGGDSVDVLELRNDRSTPVRKETYPKFGPEIAILTDPNHGNLWYALGFVFWSFYFENSNFKYVSQFEN